MTRHDSPDFQPIEMRSASASAHCFHCGEPLAGRSVTHARIGDTEAAFCCPGCQAAAGLIDALGLSDYYTLRTASASRPAVDTDEWLAFDDPAVHEPLSRPEEGGRGITLLIGGLTCPACSWLLNRVLERTPGVIRASLNSATARAHVIWNPEQAVLSQILRTVARLGYRPSPAGTHAAADQARAEQRDMLKRLAVSGFGMMQVMMFAIGLYLGDAWGMEADIRAYLRIVSLLVSTPVLLYAGRPFLLGALRALRAHRVTMDVPVSLALLLAWTASLINIARHTGEVYFDSVTMFIFLLTVARYVEMTARHRSTLPGDALSQLLPATAHRVMTGERDGQLTDVALSQVAVGDVLQVRRGEIVPADGEIQDAWTRLDESMLTGESLAVARGPGTRVAAGTLNVETPFRMRVTAVGRSTLLAGISAMLARAQSARPRLWREADRTAGRFLAWVLVIAAVTCTMWLFVNPGRAFDATLAVLVVACPCALSMATLVATASATAALARRGLLVSHPDAIEGLAKADQVMFDKTGTLTTGQMALREVNVLGPYDRDQCLALAAALEAASEHPIARAFVKAFLEPGMSHSVTPHQVSLPSVTQVRVVPGQGIEGRISGRLVRIGTAAFAAGARGAPPSRTKVTDPAGDEGIVLGGEEGLLARFILSDPPRPEARSTVASLMAQGLSVQILSGDAPGSVADTARQCGIGQWAARLSPADKLDRIREAREQGRFPIMIGDGINDAPGLGGAGVAIAMGRGSALAMAGADLILVADSLKVLPEAVELGRKAHRIMKQNLTWAALYNLCSMPLAAAGWIPPWLAAIGMSASSILVVLNSLRLMRAPARTSATQERTLETALARGA